VNAFAAYFLFALLTAPLWWPALRMLLAEVRAAGASEPLAPPPPAPLAPVAALRTTWGTTRTRLALQARVRASARRWEGGFGRRSP